MNSSLSEFILRRENYSSGHALKELIENLKRSLDQSFATGSELMDFSLKLLTVYHMLIHLYIFIP